MKSLFLLIITCLLISTSYSQKADSLRIITYNIHHAGPPTKPGTIDIDTIVSTLKKYPSDVIALQEVDVNTKRSGNVNEAKLIAEGLGMQYFFAKAIDYDGGEYGVAILSKLPLQNINVLELPMDSALKGEKRVLLSGSLRLSSGQEIVVACTHLDHQQDSRSRDLQMKTINSFAIKTTKQFVLAGDLNAETHSTTISLFDKIFQRSCATCDFSFPSDAPVKTIDFIGFKKDSRIKVVSHRVLPEPYASDHLPVRAVIKFNW